MTVKARQQELEAASHFTLTGNGEQEKPFLVSGFFSTLRRPGSPAGASPLSSQEELLKGTDPTETLLHQQARRRAYPVRMITVSHSVKSMYCPHLTL